MQASSESSRPARPTRGILADHPTADDNLGFLPYALTLADIAADPATETPLTVGMFGSWGSGKTSLMKMVDRLIGERPPAEIEAFPVQTLWFNAWLYSRDEALWRALILSVIDATRKLIDRPGRGAASEVASGAARGATRGSARERARRGGKARGGRRRWRTSTGSRRGSRR